MGARPLPQSYKYPKLSEGADYISGQLRGDKECPFSGVTKSGRVWRKVPESGAHSVRSTLSTIFQFWTQTKFILDTNIKVVFVSVSHPRSLTLTFTILKFVHEYNFKN